METAIAPQSTKIKLNNAEETPFLPEEIMNEEILTRLPVKSLLRFRCVAKSWCSLIGSKKFMKKHLETSSFAQHRIFFNSIEGFKSCSVPSLFNQPYTDSVTHNELRINFERPKESIYIAGCCNGLVCLLLGRKRFILWNPTTKKFRKLPDFDRLKKHVSITKYGFGFDELTDDFKVFGVVSVSCVRGAHIAISKVYSLRTNSWTLIEGTEASSFDGAAMYVSGKLHWDWGIRYTFEREIASFDLNSLVYGVIELPNSLKGGFSHRLGLGVLKGCLSVHCFHRKTQVDVWLMKEYGVKESWEKVVTVPYYHDPHDYSVPTPFSIGPNGEVLLYYGEVFFIYNLKDNVFRHPQINDHAIFLDLGIYVESLASVVPCVEDQRNILG